MTDLERVEPRTNLSTRAAELVEKAQKYAEAAQSPNTIRTYSGASRRWCAWCAENDFDPYPAAPEAIALYQTHLADTGKSWSTINTTLAGIEWYQKMAGHPSFRNSLPVSMVGKGIRRVNGVAPSQAKAITIEQLRKVCDALDRLEDRGFLPARDKAMILLGFAGGYRRSELVGILLKDVERDPEHGFRVMLRRSKTDQEGVGFEKGIPYGGRKATCPVRAMDGWLERHPLKDDPAAPLFIGSNSWASLNSWSVNRVVKAAMTLAGEDADGYSAHSLRAGFVTAAAKAGKRLDQIMAQTGHKSVEVAMRYIRRVELFNENPAEGLGL